MITGMGGWVVDILDRGGNVHEYDLVAFSGKCLLPADPFKPRGSVPCDSRMS